MDKKAGRPKGSTKGMTKKEIIKEISENTEIRKDVIEVILNNYSDIAFREIILNEQFTFDQILTIDSYEKKERKGFNLKLKKVVTYPATRILSVRLSKKIKYYFRWKNRNINNEKYKVNKDNWENWDVDENE